MKRVLTVTTGLVGLALALALLVAMPSTAAPPVSAPAPAPPAFTFPNPVNVSQATGNTGIARVAGSTNRAATLAWTGLNALSIEAASNDSLFGPFNWRNTLLTSDNTMGNVKMAHDSQGRIHV